jgi:uncharacterized protein
MKRTYQVFAITPAGIFNSDPQELSDPQPNHEELSKIVQEYLSAKFLVIETEGGDITYIPPEIYAKTIIQFKIVEEPNV